jgi:hypothetical protein
MSKVIVPECCGKLMKYDDLAHGYRCANCGRGYGEL